MRLIQLSRESLNFPPPEMALREPNGLLAMGGDLSPARLLNAYHRGIFPVFAGRSDFMVVARSARRPVAGRLSFQPQHETLSSPLALLRYHEPRIRRGDRRLRQRTR